MKTLFTALFLGLCTLLATNTAALARSDNYVQGDVLVQIAANADIATLVRDLQTIGTQRTGLVAKRCISPPFHIYLLQFNPLSIRQASMLYALRQHPAVTVAQNNHIIELRETTPDDAQFDQQWQYINTGAGGGLANADLDAELAWDITTGGTTPLGDEIVVAVLDEGCQSDHPDWGDNLWTNNAEIAGNGIDDDANGYIDDFKGWNIYEENDNIDGGMFSGGHGTAVAGIVGAQGNNGTGVTGVNWDVKVMFILASGNESDAIEGYSYAYTMRQRYNQSNGAEGAFVVATNASWGIDQGQPEDAPLWCAMYDQLGSVGILSAGATANANFNIDLVGDLPTACPSDYLISVTNLGKNDVKINQAGYGITTIDLGAYGEETYTLTGGAFGGSGYGEFGGTSGATPHVAGAIALLYSVPCENFALLSKTNPAEAALLVKQMILDNTTPNASLTDKTVTGGRLNLYNSTMAMLNYGCAATGCNAPYNVELSNITTHSATIEWAFLGDTAAFNIQYRIIDSPDWTTLNTAATTTVSLSELLACTTYEVAVQTVCDTTSSNWSNTLQFTTDGCCVPPIDLNISPNETTAELSWNAVTAAGAYSIVLTDQNGTATTFTTPVGVNTYNLVNLAACSNYQVQLASFCSNGLSDYSTAINFTTTGCGACIDTDYCNAGGSTNYEWIEQFVLGAIDNTSGEDTDGYGNYLNLSTDLEKGESYEATLTAGFADGAYPEFLRIWIDYNQNGTFDDNSEIAYESGDVEGEISPIFANITIPNNALLGSTRMRVAIKYTGNAGDNDPPQPCDTDNDGETEDYCINIVPAPACTDIPTDIALLVVSDVVAQIAWTGTDNCDSYDVRYRPSSQATWTNINSPTANITLSGLSPNTSYEVEVACNCGSTGSNFSTTFIFMTQPLGIADLGTMGINLLPNPFSSQLTVQLRGIAQNNSDALHLYDAQGKLLYTAHRPAAAIWVIDLSHLPNGLYLAEYLREGQSIGSQKLLKQQ
ncbi:MAG: fibronectin type III domain-containing protein [Chitinophagales bacterium]|nr:fibronectin type III domain-containing protein [Chitinophagales bacterium]